MQALPALIDQASGRWGLSEVQAVENLSYNFVAFAKRGSQDVVLKIGLPDRELKSGTAALRFFNGSGACRLVEYDEENGFLLLERLRPGEMLSTIGDDDEATHIAAQVMQNLWKPAPEVSEFIQLSDWFDGLKKIRPHFDGGTGPFPKTLLERVEFSLPELFADWNKKLLHGDFHHFNVLSSERGWLAIDPKGVIGPAGYEIGPFMLNPWKGISDGSRFKACPERSRRIQAERRAGILSERLGFEREKIIMWSTAHALLSAWWSLEDDTGWEYSMHCAKMFSEIK